MQVGLVIICQSLLLPKLINKLRLLARFFVEFAPSKALIARRQYLEVFIAVRLIGEHLMALSKHHRCLITNLFLLGGQDFAVLDNVARGE